MKGIVLTLITVFFFFSCEDNKLAGKWIEDDKYKFPETHEFQGKYHIVSNNGKDDTFSYKIKDTILLSISKQDTQAIEFHLIGDSVLILNNYKFKKAHTNWFFEDVKAGIKEKIDLPEGTGTKTKFYDNSFMYFITLSGNNIIIRHGEIKIASELDLVMAIDAKKETCMQYRNQHIFFADKDIPYFKISQIMKVFEYTNEHSIYLAIRNRADTAYNRLYAYRIKSQGLSECDNDKLNKRLNFLSDSINKFDSLYEHIYFYPRQNTKHPPASIEYLKNIEKPNRTIVKLYNDSLLLDNIKTQEKDYLSHLKNTTKNNRKHMLLYFINDNVIYDNYIHFFDKTIQVYYELRNEFTLRNYSKSFEELNDSIKRQIRYKYPLAIYELQKEELGRFE